MVKLNDGWELVKIIQNRENYNADIFMKTIQEKNEQIKTCLSCTCYKTCQKHLTQIAASCK